jgi:uncharacterized protein (TIGR03083 family)
VIAAAAALDVMRAIGDDDPRWSAVAAPTDWTAFRTVEHISDALVFYAGLVARRARERHGFVRNGRDAPASVQLDDAQAAAAILAAVLRDLGDERALHPSGLADASGWAGMAVTELLVHGYDAASALGLTLEFPPEVCARTLARVFPWIEVGERDPGMALLAATGRIATEADSAPVDWWWQSAPLSEWDGLPRRRTAPPAWS